MASVFPLEIFERIIDLSMDDETPTWARRELLKWSRVSHAWRRQCLPLVLRKKTFSWPELTTLYSFRRQALVWPDLASLIQEVEVQQWLRPYGSQIEMMPFVIYPHLPRLRRVTINLKVNSIDRTHSHRYFRISRLRFDSVTELTLNGFLLRDTSELDVHLSMFPQTRTLCLRNVWWRPHTKKMWPRSPKLVPPIADLELTREGIGWKKWMLAADRVGLEVFLHSVGRTLTTLAINLPVIHSLTAGEEVPFELENFCFPNLRSLRLTMDCARTGTIEIQLASSQTSYRDHIINIPKLILRLEAHNLLTLWLSFCVEFVQPDPGEFLQHLCHIVAPMESLIPTSSPRLQVVTFDVGSLEETIPWWNAQLRSIFAPLQELHAVEIRVPVRRLDRWGQLI
ncbi:hypothetical protein K466DRAFT_256308 [Polyporus arcularius HHB13444]|uniref:F-box domain-containing protein n=1 Tax=Polyporus arcularius HHB13444 TaxID=1314778 RepID=A0A5C3Q110_9APHY|nr:hypothetical protein K466DRAFT_256308 [Polyporus arcularius HHB13444]